MQSSALLAVVALVLSGCTADKVIGANDCAPGAVEACDGVDNDCDGEVDEDIPGAGLSCDTGGSGTCAEGAMACESGQMVCLAVTAELEICDGVDNDCDGSVDEDAGGEPYDEGLNGGTVSDVAFDPRADSVAYALVGNRVHRSTDGGATFHHRGSASHSLRDLAFPPDEPSALLAASESGLLRSDDAGISWEPVSLDGLVLHSLFIHPADPSHVYVGTQGAGIYRSTNGGVSFDPVNTGVPLSRANRFAGDPKDPDRVTVTLFLLDDQGGLDGGAILHTGNGGASWEPALDGVGRVLGLSRCPGDADLLLAGIWGEGVAISQDGGATWNLAGLGGAAVQDVAAASADCNVVYASAYPEGVYRSLDGGASFEGPVDDGMNVQFPGQVFLAADPEDPARVIGGNHSGVFRNADWPNGWTRVETIGPVNVTTLVTHPVDPNMLLLGSWGQGVWSRPSPSSSWQRFSSSALPRDWIMSISFDDTDPDNIAVGALGDLWMSVDAGNSFTETGLQASVLDLVFTVGGDLVAATQTLGVQRSSDGGATWNDSNDGLPDPWPTAPCLCRDTRALVVDSAVPTTLYLATNGKGVHRSEDAGISWQPLGTVLSDERVVCLEPHGTALYACVEGKGIWRRTRQDPDFVPMTTGNAGLSNVRGLVVDEMTGIFYATSDAGVFRSLDGAIWEPLDGNACLSTTDLGPPAMVGEGDERRVAAAAAGAGILGFHIP